jgi:hypothetical protein
MAAAGASLPCWKECTQKLEAVLCTHGNPQVLTRKCMRSSERQRTSAQVPTDSKQCVRISELYRASALVLTDTTMRTF